MGSGMALHRGADRPWRHIEQHIGNRDRHRRPIERDGCARPSRPQHVRNDNSGAEHQHREAGKRQHQPAARGPAHIALGEDVSRHVWWPFWLSAIEYGTLVNLSLSKPWRPAASSAMNYGEE